MAIRTARGPVLLALLAPLACAPVPPDAGPEAVTLTLPAPLPAMRRFAQQAPRAPQRSNAEMAQDFLDLNFAMESGRALPALTRFDGTITIALAGEIPPTAPQDLEELLARLRREARIPIAAAAPGQQANITVAFHPKRVLQDLVPNAACYVVPGVRGLADFTGRSAADQPDWSTLDRRTTATIFIPSDVGPQEVRDCLHEETAQALGPLNDLYRLPDSVFNDDNFHAVLTGFDMLMLRAHYAPALANGMDRAEVAARLPDLLRQINPAGEGRAAALPGPTPRNWTDAIETALAQTTPPRRRLRAAERAVVLAQDNGWQDTRRGFSLFVLGRTLTNSDPEAAAAVFQAARAVYAAGPDNAIQLAHVDMQLAAYALTRRDGATAARLARGAIPAATQAQNAGLLSSLLQIEAAAMDLQGKPQQAQALRGESIGWARYGIGDDLQMLALMADIASLAAHGAER